MPVIQVACPNCEHVNAVAGSGSQLCVRCRTPLPIPPPATPEPAIEQAAAGGGGDTGSAEPPMQAEADDALPELDLPPEKLALVRSLSEQIKTRPKAVALYLQLEKVYVEAGRRDLAIHVLKRSLLKADPKNATVKARLDVLTRQEARRDPASPALAASVAAAGPPEAAPSHAVGPGVSPLQSPRPAVAPGGGRGQLLRAAAAIGVLAVAGYVAGRIWLPSARPLIAGSFAAQSPVYSPDGKSIAFVKVATDPMLCVFDVASGATRELSAISYGGGIAWSPDGRYLAFQAEVRQMEGSGDWEEDSGLPVGSAVYLVDPEGGEATRLAMGGAPSWLHDGMAVAMLCDAEVTLTPGNPELDMEEMLDESSRPCVVNVMTRARTDLAEMPARRIRASPTDMRIAFEVDAETEVAFDDGTMDRIIDNVAGGTTNIGEGERALGRELEARSMGGSDDYLLTGNIHVAGADGKGHRRLTDDGKCAGATFLPDGDLVYLHRGATKREILRVGAAGGAPSPLLGAPIEIADPGAITFTPDGRDLVAPVVVGEANPGVAAVMTGMPPVDIHIARIGKSKVRRLETPQPFKWSYSLSPDGKWLVYEATNPDTQLPEIWRARL